MLCVGDKIILIDPAGWDGDTEMGWAHLSGHMDYHFDALGRLDTPLEDEADYYATIRLDRAGSRV